MQVIELIGFQRVELELVQQVDHASKVAYSVVVLHGSGPRKVLGV